MIVTIIMLTKMIAYRYEEHNIILSWRCDTDNGHPFHEVNLVALPSRLQCLLYYTMQVYTKTSQVKYLKVETSETLHESFRIKHRKLWRK